MPSVDHAERSDPGRHPDKQVNEDAFGSRSTPLGHLAVVCDGMGGHQFGKEASNAALAAIFEVMGAAPIGADPRETLKRAIESANARVFALASPASGSTRPGSTVVAILLHANGIEIAHVGDSRCYRVRAGLAEQMTRDHSIVSQLIAAGVLDPEQAKKHPDAKRITRALGAHEDVEVEMQSVPVALGDTFLLCSDGLSDLVTPPDMAGVADEPPDQIASRLVDLANERGGHDNITAVIVRVTEPKPRVETIDLEPAPPLAEPQPARIDTIDIVPSQRPPMSRPSVTPTPSPVISPIPVLPLEPEKSGPPKILFAIGGAVVLLVIVVIALIALRPPPPPESNCNVLYDFGGGGAQPCSGGVTWKCGEDKYEFICKCPGTCDCRKNDHFVTSVAPGASVCGACSFREPGQSVASQCGFPW